MFLRGLLQSSAVMLALVGLYIFCLVLHSPIWSCVILYALLQICLTYAGMHDTCLLINVGWRVPPHFFGLNIILINSIKLVQLVQFVLCLFLPRMDKVDKYFFPSWPLIVGNLLVRWTHIIIISTKTQFLQKCWCIFREYKPYSLIAFNTPKPLYHLPSNEDNANCQSQGW